MWNHKITSNRQNNLVFIVTVAFPLPAARMIMFLSSKFLSGSFLFPKGYPLKGSVSTFVGSEVWAWL